MYAESSRQSGRRASIRRVEMRSGATFSSRGPVRGCNSRDRIQAARHRPVRRARLNFLIRSNAPVAAVDIPSGADADAMARQQGKITRAHSVVTFTAPCPAHICSVRLLMVQHASRRLARPRRRSFRHST